MTRATRSHSRLSPGLVGSPRLCVTPSPGLVGPPSSPGPMGPPRPCVTPAPRVVGPPNGRVADPGSGGPGLSTTPLELQVGSPT
jgi:hypothetical protein